MKRCLNRKSKIEFEDGTNSAILSAGFSLSEMLVAVLILSLVAAGLATGIAASVRVYQQSVQYSETQTLVPTLITAIEDELRFAEKIDPKTDPPTFTSRTYGEDVMLLVKDGKVAIGKSTDDFSYLVSAGLYPAGVEAILTYEYKNNTFHVELELSDNTTAEVSVVPINE